MSAYRCAVEYRGTDRAWVGRASGRKVREYDGEREVERKRDWKENQWKNESVENEEKGVIISEDG